MSGNQQNQQEINIELGEQEAAGIYSNLAILSYTISEFFIDFTRIVPGSPKAKVLSRIITSPQHAKMLYLALQNKVISNRKQIQSLTLTRDILLPKLMTGQIRV